MSLIDGLQTQSVSETVFQKIVIPVRYIMKKTPHNETSARNAHAHTPITRAHQKGRACHMKASLRVGI